MKSKIIKLCLMAIFIYIFVKIGKKLDKQFSVYWYMTGWVLRGISYKIDWVIDGCL